MITGVRRYLPVVAAVLVAGATGCSAGQRAGNQYEDA
jgi:hypothetical protein